MPHMIKQAIETIHEKNRIIDNIINVLLASRHILFLGHKSPDEDCIGSMVAFALLTGKFMKKGTVYLSEVVHEHFQYLLNICSHNAINCSDDMNAISDPPDVIAICDTPKRSMLDVNQQIEKLLDDPSVLKIEIDHHLGADSRYIGDEGYCLVTEATSSSELVGLIGLKLAKRKDILEKYGLQNPLSRNIVLAILTGIVGDTNMGQFIQSKRQRRYYDIFSNLYSSMLQKETTKSTNFMNKEEVFREIQRLSATEEECHRYFISKKKSSRNIGYVVLDEEDMRYLTGRFDVDTIISVSRSIADLLAEESARLGLVVYDESAVTGLVQCRLRRGHGYKRFDLRKVLEIFAISDGGGHEGAIGFRVKRDRINDLNTFVADLVSGIEKSLPAEP